ncbi:MAG: MiaB/RimO family radical SAM methylthiotransferase [Candidatus Muiribacteriaceae bacterium]
MKTYRIINFGCKVNQYNGAAIEANLRRAGLYKSENADVIIINMCSLTSNAVRKARLLLNRVKRENQGSTIILTGCIEKHNSFEVHAKIHTRDREEIYHFLGISEFTEVADSIPGHTRSFVLIQEGCREFCTYCIVPYMRDYSYSKPFDVIKEEISSLAEKGVKEIVLTGTHINDYNFNSHTLKEIIHFIDSESEIKRFRISSIEPQDISGDLINTLKNSGKFCPHLHISVQSGSDTVLKRMNRKYNSSCISDLIERLRSIPYFEWSGDLIVGFPGETDDEFSDSVELIKKELPVSLHVFPFSARKGTEAYQMSGKISGDVIKRRAFIMRKLAEEVGLKVRRRYIGKTLRVLLEKEENGIYTGYSQNYIKTDINKSEDSVLNEIRDVSITDADKNLKGEFL